MATQRCLGDLQCSDNLQSEADVRAGLSACADRVGEVLQLQAQGFGCINFTVGPDSKGSNAAFSAVAGGIVGLLAGTLFGMQATETWVPGTVGAK